MATLELNFLERPLREAQLLLMFHLNKDELYLMMNQETVVEQESNYLQLIAQRAKNIPYEYITNRVSFYSQEFFIKEGALIPRPETELLLDEVFKLIDKDADVQFAEVGVGSGIISTLLAQNYKNAQFIASDISPDAIEIAKQNFKEKDVEDKIEVRLGSLLDPYSEQIDVLVSNPPYIANDADLESNLDYEPSLALFGGEVGDEIVKALIDEVLARRIAYFFCEFGYDQKDKVANYLQDNSDYTLSFYDDLAGFNRGFILKLL